MRLATASTPIFDALAEASESDDVEALRLSFYLDDWAHDRGLYGGDD